MSLLLGLVPVAIWLVLLLARGGFWLCRERDSRDPAPEPAAWPRVVAVVPARDEADVIARSIGSLRAQDYPGPFSVILVDDGSTDGTAEAAMSALGATADRAPLEVLRGEPLPGGWTGKLWALSQGVRHAGDAPDYLLLTDADIGHAPDNLRALVARAEAGRLSLVSLMAELSCATAAERFLIPAFVFFFQTLYPFRWVADARARTAAGAGGCMLVRREALERIGGIAAIRTAIIDDCNLARRLKGTGPIRLDLTRRARSLRPYGGVAEIGRMVSRSAYAQLGYSPLLLAGTVLGMALTYLLPPALALFGDGPARIAGLVAWAMMALAFQPMLRFYRVSPLWGPALPVIGAAYTWFTLQSALQVWRGKGGMWKGRAQAMAGRA
ncbi:glycosyltransferase [Roseomonas populi]|uniref:Glycosyltransferase n=1 Tax=Roseomonas populi TaxID=3121582 RepID=A0ABT1X9Q4_9PROT|nr:glycosyltransferase [Roseomonas pecuniae]MCR0984832.1 glycosyltransferase [Roseomonas pecuniae]